MQREGMTILCIETSTQVCSAAICRDGECVEQRISREGGNHAKLLPVFIDELLQGVKARGERIDAVALSEGPGSYTGLRIGTSTAKGLCYGLNIPLIPVPTLHVLCAAAYANTEYSIQRTDLLCPMIDARRMEVYTAFYERELREESLEFRGDKAKAVVVEDETSLNPQYGVSRLEEPSPLNIYYFGDGAAKCQQVLTAPNWHYIPDIVPEAKYMRGLANGRIAKGECIEGTELAYYEPFYLKEFVAAPSHVKGLG